MCNPMAIMVGTMAIAALGGLQQMDASRQAQRYNEQVANNNTTIAEFKAIDAERLGAVEADERRLKTRLQLGEQTTGFAAQNVEASGTALQILGDTEAFGQLDVQRIRGNAARSAWGFRQEGQGFQAQKRLDSFTAKAERRGTILTTAGKMLGAYGSYKSATGGA